MCVVPFSKPSIAAVSADELEAFDEIDEMIDSNLLCQALGWIIKQKGTIHNKQKLRATKQKLLKTFTGRALANWALVALSTQEVRYYTYYYTYCVCIA